MKGTMIQQFAVCRDCAWDAAGRNAQGRASQHAEREEHRVIVETRIAYDGRPPREEHPDLMAALKASLDAVKARGDELRKEAGQDAV